MTPDPIPGRRPAPAWQAPSAARFPRQQGGGGPPDRGGPARRLAGVLALVWALALGGCGASPGEPVAPVLVIGADGLEWSVLRPLMEAGECPNLRALMERGMFGRLGTFVPTWSPVVWTSIATGKGLEDHEIRGFIDNQKREYTSSRRRGRALWNIADRYGRTSKVFGWWITWPVEEVAGMMVSATSASALVDDNWKPALVEGLPDQVHPPELTDRVMALAREAGSQESVLAIEREHVFGPLPWGTMTEAERKLVTQSRWSIQSDATYHALAREFLAEGPADLNLVYFGGTDVVGHRFWRHYQPDKYTWKGSSPEVDAALADTIPNYYRWFDTMVGELMEAVGEDTTVMVVSDHGMHAISLQRPNARQTTGDHQDAPPGVLIAAGPGIEPSGDVERFLITGLVPVHGNVLTVAPTVLGLLGIPPARDMLQRPYLAMLDEPTRAFVSGLGMVDSHDGGFREPTMLEVPSDKEAEFTQRMKELGYLGDDAAAPEAEGTQLVDPESYEPDLDSGTAEEQAAAGSGDG